MARNLLLLRPPSKPAIRALPVYAKLASGRAGRRGQGREPSQKYWIFGLRAAAGDAFVPMFNTAGERDKFQAGRVLERGM
jgi:hypothetical protein